MSTIRAADELTCRIVDLLIVIPTGALDCRKGRSYLALRDFEAGNDASTLGAHRTEGSLSKGGIRVLAYKLRCPTRYDES
jgi:hypothetical protein